MNKTNKLNGLIIVKKMYTIYNIKSVITILATVAEVTSNNNF